ncbi:AprI/Inh family metalloprotease inhibitor [Gellertiella hungarica]|nr:AprI/Inh family metalloprotease inhibitor [Gellertiella hungarica]
MRLGKATAGVAMVLALAGCQRTADSGFGTQASLAPAPLAAQPVPGVQSSQLPAPGAPAGSAQFPAAPAQQASLPGAAGTDAAAASGLDVKKEAMVGSWRVSGASSCDMFLTLTNLGSGSRGGTRGCAGELTMVRSWEVSGKQVQFKDSNGNLVGSVYKTAENQFTGTTASGQPINLSR